MVPRDGCGPWNQEQTTYHHDGKWMRQRPARARKTPGHTDQDVVGADPRQPCNGTEGLQEVAYTVVVSAHHQHVAAQRDDQPPDRQSCTRAP